MATANPARRPQAQRAPSPRTPAMIAIERLAKMAAAGANANKMVGTLDGILHGWTLESVPASQVREWVQQLQTDIEAGVQAAEDYVSEADTDKGRAAAQSQLDALMAVQSRLVAVAGLMK